MGTESANQALNTLEILEMILLQTDMRTLLASAQRVCHKWADLIAHSPSIQKTLFFTPIQESEWGTGIKIFNPILTKTIDSSFPFKNEPEDWENFALSAFMMIKDHSGVAAFTRKDASWRKMLADQQMEESGYRGLRMERLFELLLFDESVIFFRWTTCVYMLSHASSRQSWRHKKDERMDNEFSRMLDKFGLILYICRVMPCGMGVRVYPTREYVLKAQALQAYEKQGFNLHGTRKKIEESLSEYRTVYRSMFYPSEEDEDEDEDEDEEDDDHDDGKGDGEGESENLTDGPTSP
ncbi:hypothetical protein N7454_004132 [Penicillium verhagenii]|nr:hypothetical protein N7454_004132 [Penicillium verhagenii]